MPLPAMATSHAPLALTLVGAIVIAFVLILAACWQGSRDRTAHRAGLPVWCYVAIILIAVLLYYRLPEVYGHMTTAMHMLAGK